MATDVSEALRVQTYLLSKATNADERADITALQARSALSGSRSCSTLTALPAGLHAPAVQPAARAACRQAFH